MPEWVTPTVALLPLATWIFLGVGGAWALAVLPRELWRARAILLAVSLALGPMLVTAALFVLGTFARLTLAGTLLSSAALAALGAGIAWRRARTPAAGARVWHEDRSPLSALEWALVAGIAALLLLNVVITAYWPFIAYDTQWVYGYNARIFLLRGEIPDSMGYYPQLIPLSYTAMQQAWHALGGDLFDDHAARVVIPWFNAGAALMAYTLGRLAFERRRAGLLTAAVWAFYPHVAAWSGAGDLEIPLALYTAGAAAFFIPAWRAERTDYALVSGLLLGGALWTKPTGGALALGIGLAVLGAAVAARGRWQAWRPRLRIALVTALACAPIGGMWYARNAALGHELVTFPASYWHDFAQRSGQELGWPLLIAALIAGALLLDGAAGPRSARWGALRRWLPLIALILLLAGSLPTALRWGEVRSADDVWTWVRGDASAARRMGWLAWSAVILGAALLAWAAWPRWRALPARLRQTVTLIVALGLPYALAWFFDFSYHYRLSFAIAPLAAALVAALLDGWLWDWLAARRVGRALGAALATGAFAVAAFAAVQHSAQVWRGGGLPDDTAKYDQGNPALMVVVHTLEDYAAQHGAPVVAIPGEDRLPFFFPTWDIRNSRDPADLPTRLEDLAGVDVFVNGSAGLFLAQWAGLWPNSLQAEADVATAYYERQVRGGDGRIWPTVLQPIPMGPNGSVAVDDGNFRYAAFTIHPEARGYMINPGGARRDTVLFGDFARLLGHDLVSLDFQRGETVPLLLYWQATEDAPPPLDYSVYVHLLDAEGNLIAGWDSAPLLGKYPTRFWTPGERLLDYRPLRVPEDLPLGPASLRIGIYEPISGERLPVTLDGAPSGDGLTIETRIVVR